MSRKRTTPDADVLAAAGRVISRLGPARFTLADVAAESGLAPATLLQRFGSKRGLLLAFAKMGEDSVAECFTELRRAHSSALATLFAAVEEMSAHAQTPEAMANSLTFLQIHLTDPDFHRLAVESTRAIVAGLRKLLDEAVSARELVRCDTARLARVIDALRYGSMLTWAIHREGSVGAWLRADLRMLLAPLRKNSSKSRK
jgi:AcrR family transcriptional regulator